VEILPGDYSPLDPELGRGDNLSVSPFPAAATQFFYRFHNRNEGFSTLLRHLKQPPADALTSGFTPDTKECSCAKAPKPDTRAIHTDMQVLFQQLGGLFLASLPTLFLFIFLVIAYQVLVQGPLSRTLRERRARTAGAVEEADKAIAAAAAKTDDYANKLRQARAEVFRAREQRLQQAAQERESLLDQARKAATKKVLEARLALESEAKAAQAVVMASADQLAEQVVRAVLPATAGGSR
jgi:F-type H+-transporting ATPase subunit b